MNSITVPIISPLGEYIDERVYMNTPFSELYPGDKLTTIKWLFENQKKPTARRVDNERFAITDLVSYGGNDYCGAWASGSANKKGETFGLTHDIGWESGMMRYVEDVMRFQRWLLAQGYFGFNRRKYRIKLLPEKTMTKWGQVADGFGYFARPPVNNRTPIKLGRSKGSYTFWQRIPYSNILWDEIKPLIDNRIMNISGSVAAMLTSGNSLDQKAKLVDINPEMVEHPFVALAIQDAWGEYLERVSTTAPVGTVYRLAVPADPSIEFVESGDAAGSKIVITRYPVDSYSSIQAVETNYSERIADMEAIQYSLSAYDVFFKGCAAIIDEPDLDGYDAILCNKDLKMAYPNLSAIQFDGDWSGDACLSITQRYQKGSCIGVNVDWFATKFGGDTDGDGAEITFCNGLPALYDAVKSLPEAVSPKLPKVKRLLKQGDYRPEFIEMSMQNLVGFASNVTSQVLAKANQESQALLLGFDNASHLHEKLNYAIKMGTDGLKTNIDPSFVVAMLTSVQAKLSQDEINPAPWTQWGNADNDSFIHSIPKVFDSLIVKDMKYYGINGAEEEELSDEEFNNAVSKEYHTGMIGIIASYVLPAIKDMLGEAGKHQPLSYFRRWGLQRQELIPIAKEIRDWWNIHQSRTNWADPKDILSFKSRFTDKVNEIVEREQCDRWELANTLWVISHSARGLDNQAACVFFAFPEECESIILLRPGDTPEIETVITGLSYQLPTYLAGEIEVDVVDVDIPKNGKHVIRKALVAKVAGQKQPQSPYPKDMIALVAFTAPQPPVGKYVANILKISENSHRCILRD